MPLPHEILESFATQASITSGGVIFHAPRVKSGTSIVLARFATEASLSGVTHDQTAACTMFSEKDQESLKGRELSAHRGFTGRRKLSLVLPQGAAWIDTGEFA